MAKIGLDAGHYVGDGRVAKDFRTALGTSDEYTLNLRVYQVVERLLKAAGHTVIDIGRQEQSVTVRAQRAAQNGCDIVVSIHHNAGGGRGATLYRHKNGVTGSRSRELQEALYAHIEKVNKGNRSTPINTEELGVINCSVTKCPAVLIECAFMDNAADVALINSSGYADRMGAAVASGINDYTGYCGAGSTDIGYVSQAVVLPAADKTYIPWAYAKVKGLTEADPLLNVRSGPGTGYGVIRQLANGNEVDVLERYVNGWVKINIINQLGYVYAGYLDIQERQNTKQTVTVAGCTMLNVRKTPNGTVMGTVKAGTVLEVIGSGKDSDGDIWQQIRTGNLTGYVWPKYVK